MNIRQLEHVLRDGGSITGCRELVVIGSQALLASRPDAPGGSRRLDEGRLLEGEGLTGPVLREW